MYALLHTDGGSILSRWSAQEKCQIFERKSVFILNVVIIHVDPSVNMSQHQLHLFEFK
jgi:hypothetical protein